jgi:hypothetical protein
MRNGDIANRNMVFFPIIGPCSNTYAKVSLGLLDVTEAERLPIQMRKKPPRTTIGIGHLQRHVAPAVCQRSRSRGTQDLNPADVANHEVGIIDVKDGQIVLLVVEDNEPAPPVAILWPLSHRAEQSGDAHRVASLMVVDCSARPDPSLPLDLPAVVTPQLEVVVATEEAFQVDPPNDWAIVLLKAGSSAEDRYGHRKASPTCPQCREYCPCERNYDARHKIVVETGVQATALIQRQQHNPIQGCEYNQYYRTNKEHSGHTA